MTEKTKQPLTDELMNELVFADVNDPSAWGEPVIVFTARANHFAVFVWYPDSGEPDVPPAVYVVASEQLRSFIAEHEGPSISLSRLDAEFHARNAWQRLAVPTAA